MKKFLTLFLFPLIAFATGPDNRPDHNRMFFLWEGANPAIDDKVEFILMGEGPTSQSGHLGLVPATVFCTGVDAAEEVLLEILVSDHTVDHASAVYVEVIVDSTTYQFDANTSARTINSPGIYRVKTATAQTGVTCGVSF